MSYTTSISSRVGMPKVLKLIHIFYQVLRNLNVSVELNFDCAIMDIVARATETDNCSNHCRPNRQHNGSLNRKIRLDGITAEVYKP